MIHSSKAKTDFPDGMMLSSNPGSPDLSPIPLGSPASSATDLMADTAAANLNWLKAKELWWAVFSVVFSFGPAALAGFPDSLGLGIFFMFGTIIANVLFQVGNLNKMLHPKQNAVSTDVELAPELGDGVSEATPLLSSPKRESCHFLGVSWYHWLGLPLSIIGNLPLAIAASDGYDIYFNPDDFGIKFLKSLALIGVLTEAILSIKAFGDLPKDVKDFFEIAKEGRVSKLLVCSAAFMGVATALMYSWNGVDSIKEALKGYLSGHQYDHLIDSDGMYAGLFLANIYPVIFGCVYGMVGAFDLFSKIIPRMVGFKGRESAAEDTTLGAWLTFICVSWSVGPSAGIQRASKSAHWKTAEGLFSRLGVASCIFTNTAPTTIKAGNAAAKAATVFVETLSSGLQKGFSCGSHQTSPESVGV
jgi:hypothetical protein